MLGRSLLLRLAGSPRLERFVKRNAVSARFARRFVAGERLEDVVEPVRLLNHRGITATLDFLGENVHSESEAAESTSNYHRLLQFIDSSGLQSNVSLKLTQLGLDISADLAQANLNKVLEDANRYGQFIRIDMEGSAYTERTLSVFYNLWEFQKNVGVVIQSCLYRSAADTEKLMQAGARVRLVKGAYYEPKEVAYQSKSDVDRNYVSLMTALLERGYYPAIATHDERLIQAAIHHTRKNAIPVDRFEFQMLFGIRRERQFRLIDEGYRMRVYVPFGTQWYPYMMRRLAERPANLFFVLKNLLKR